MTFLWGLWNGITAWPLLVLHAFGALGQYPIFDITRDGGWYQFGFLIGAGSPFLGVLGNKKAKSRGDDGS
jgi:hypothetical protein